MQECCTCRQVKPFDQFHKRNRSKTGYQSQCKECNRIAVRKHIAKDTAKFYAQNKASRDARINKYREYKASRGCHFCNEKEPVCLEMHHLDPSTKEVDPSTAVNQSWEWFEREAEKCIVVCANCHRKVHAGILTL